MGVEIPQKNYMGICGDLCVAGPKQIKGLDGVGLKVRAALGRDVDR